MAGIAIGTIIKLLSLSYHCIAIITHINHLRHHQYCQLSGSAGQFHNIYIISVRRSIASRQHHRTNRQYHLSFIALPIYLYHHITANHHLQDHLTCPRHQPFHHHHRPGRRRCQPAPAILLFISPAHPELDQASSSIHQPLLLQAPRPPGGTAPADPVMDDVTQQYNNPAHPGGIARRRPPPDEWNLSDLKSNLYGSVNKWMVCHLVCLVFFFLTLPARQVHPDIIIVIILDLASSFVPGQPIITLVLMHCQQPAPPSVRRTDTLFPP